ncbi:acyl carrier protein [Sulfurimonas sp.]
MNERVEKVFKDIFEIDIVYENASFGSISEWDSFSHINLMMQLEEEFGVKISLSKSQELKTVEKITNFLTNEKCF